MLGRHRYFFPLGPWLRSALGVALFLSLGATGPALAGTFNVVPPRLELNPGQRATSLEVVSAQDKPLLIRATLKHWTQLNGEDVYDTTEDVAVVPPVFKLEAGGRQVLRVGFLGRPRPLDTESAYRLFLTEVPNAIPDPEDDTAPKPKTLGLVINTKLTISLPLYVMPRTSRSLDLLRASVQTGVDGKRRVVLDNAGTVHQRMEKVELVGSNGQSVPFDAAILLLLPGATRSLPMSREAAALPPPYRLRFLRDLNNSREIDVTAS